MNMDPEELARLFHEAYERLAPVFGYKTRDESAVAWEDVPHANRALMYAVCDELLDQHLIAWASGLPDWRDKR